MCGAFLCLVFVKNVAGRSKFVKRCVFFQSAKLRGVFPWQAPDLDTVHLCKWLPKISQPSEFLSCTDNIIQSVFTCILRFAHLSADDNLFLWGAPGQESWNVFPKIFSLIVCCFQPTGRWLSHVLWSNVNRKWIWHAFRLYLKWTLLVWAESSERSSPQLNLFPEVVLGNCPSMYMAMDSSAPEAGRRSRVFFTYYLQAIPCLCSIRSQFYIHFYPNVGSILCVTCCHLCCILQDVRPAGGKYTTVKHASVSIQERVIILLRRSKKYEIWIHFVRTHTWNIIFK